MQKGVSAGAGGRSGVLLLKRAAAATAVAAAAAAVVGTISLARQLKNTRRGRSVKPRPHDRPAGRKEDSTGSVAHTTRAGERAFVALLNVVPTM